jgi:hypothetical protein
MTSRTLIRIMFCSVMALLIMTATALVFMIVLHSSDLAEACGVKEPCTRICHKCGARL